ncbi:TolC family protein [Croceicoccus sp. F390]|uniref:TolC family protein n=1 Tax=Croceicoccus esteveae TaxID=3075597 RepID=A0ABU2ZKE4_9SPHN|nr:TolC family protein [Croceicoccus sp. F390]MDT0577070.1 TolC family protein [Croceicoccus sp. F390]
MSVLACALGGCATIEAPVRAPVTLPDAFLLAPVPQDEPLDLRALLPVSDAAFVKLNQAAMAGAPTLEAALARIELARAELAAARAGQRPDIRASGAITGRRIGAQQIGSLPSGVPLDRENVLFQTGIEASYDTDLFGGLRASARAAQARLSAAGADARAVRLALTGDIATGVIAWRALAEQLIVAEGDLEQANALVDITAERVRVGVASDTDRVRAASLAADALTRIEAIGGERAQVLGQLVTLTALPAQQVLPVLQTAAPDPALRPVDAAVPMDILRNRPDVQAAEARLRAADAEIAAAAAARFPRLTLSALAGLAALTAGDLFGSDAITGSVGPTLAGPLFDFGRVAARIDASEAQAREAFARYRRSVFVGLGEAETAFGQITSADRQVAQLTRQVALDEDAAMLVAIRYRNGVESFVGVAEARRQAFAARQRLADAKARARTTRVALFRALGGAEDMSDRQRAPGASDAADPSRQGETP